MISPDLNDPFPPLPPAPTFSPSLPAMFPPLSWPEAVVNIHPLDVDIVVISVAVPFTARGHGATLSIHISPAKVVPYLARGRGQHPPI